MRTTAMVVAVLAATAMTASAQIGVNPCAALPNGGKLTIKVSGPVVNPGCPACGTTMIIPANYVLGFSDASQNTCELKAPDGTNSNLCKATSTCPPASTRVLRDGVWKCQAPDIDKVIDCPIPSVRAETPTPPGGPPRPQCLDQFKVWEERLKARAAELKTSVSRDASVAGPAAQAAVSGTLEAVAIMTLMYYGRDFYNAHEVMTTGAGTQASKQRRQAIANKMSDAVRRADTALGVLVSGARTSSTEVATAVRSDLEEARKQADACVAEVENFLSRK